MKASFWVAVVLIVAGEVPDDEGLVSTSREEHIWALSYVSAFSHLCPQIITYFSSDVAKLVTHPLCPSRVPRITNCSAIFGRELI